MDGGAFEELPYRGERIPIEDDSPAGEWAMAHRILREAGAAPPWIEADKEARRLMAALDALVDRAPTLPLGRLGRARADGAQLVANANRAIARLNDEAPTDRQHRRRLDPVAEAARLEAAFERR